MTSDAFRQAAAAAIERDNRQIASRIDGGNIQIMLFAEPDADLSNRGRIHALADLALADLRNRQKTDPPEGEPAP